MNRADGKALWESCPASLTIVAVFYSPIPSRMELELSEVLTFPSTNTQHSLQALLRIFNNFGIVAKQINFLASKLSFLRNGEQMPARLEPIVALLNCNSFINKFDRIIISGYDKFNRRCLQISCSVIFIPVTAQEFKLEQMKNVAHS